MGECRLAVRPGLMYLDVVPLRLQPARLAVPASMALSSAMMTRIRGTHDAGSLVTGISR
jgi:hypothetical protein